MSLASFYIFIYLLLVAVLTFSARANYVNRTVQTTPSYGRYAQLLILATVLVLFIGFRPHSGVFMDTMNYIYGYENDEGNYFVFDPNAENFLFDNIFSFFSSARLGIDSFFVFIATVYFGAAAIAVIRLFKNDAFIAYLVFLAAFSTFSYATNGIKAGAAASIFLLALSYRQYLIPCLLLMFVSIGMHHSMKMPVIAFVITLFFKNPKYYFYGWCFSALMAVGHVSFFQNLFAGFTDESGADYLGANGYGEDSYISGFRLDFMLYSAMPVWVGYIAKIKKHIKSKMYDTLLYTYITTNAVWMLCMYASFTNRIAYLSWCIYPIVLIYPYLNENWGVKRYSQFAKIMIYHLCFTLFMELVYYGGIAKILGI